MKKHLSKLKKYSWLLCLAVAVTVCLAVGTALAKFITEIEVGSFNLSFLAEEQAYAVYCADDNSLEFFYGYAPSVGGTSPTGKTVTAVYTGIDTTQYLCYTKDGGDGNYVEGSSLLPKWNDYASEIVSVSFHETFKTVTPISTSGWFYNFTAATSFDFTNLDTSNVNDMSNMFYKCSAVKTLDLSGFDTSNVTNMRGMFRACSLLTTLNISSFNTSQVTDMSRLFAGCQKVTSLNVSSFDTSNVTNMHHMFAVCDSLTSLDLSNFDTANVTNMSYMFSCGASSKSKLQSVDLSSFDTSNVTLMNHMFNECKSLKELNLESFNIDAVKDFQYMFANCEKLETIYVASTWKVGSKTTTPGMFNGCDDLKGGNGTKWADMNALYGETACSTGTYAIIDGSGGKPGYLTGEIIQEEETDANYFVVYGEAFDANKNSLGKALYFYNRTPPSEADTQIYLEGSSGAYQKIEATYDLSGTSWRENASKIVAVNIVDIIEPTTTAYWFSGFEVCASFKNLSNLKTTNATSMEYMFNNCKLLTNADLSALTIDTANADSLRYMFYNCSKLTNSDGKTFNFTNSAVDANTDGEIDEGSTATVKLTDLHSMFRGCGNIKTLDLGGLYIAETSVNLAYMFRHCEQVTEIVFSDRKISSFAAVPTNGNKPNYGTAHMFENCHDLKEVDISFIKCKTTSAIEMFSNCYDITTIYADTAFEYDGKVDGAVSMFAQCNSLVGGNGMTLAEAKSLEPGGDGNVNPEINSKHARIDGNNGFAGYLTAKDGDTMTYANVNVELSAGCNFTWSFNKVNTVDTVGQEYFYANEGSVARNVLKLTANADAELPDSLTVTIDGTDKTAEITYDKKEGTLTIPANLLTRTSTITIGVGN